MTSARDAMPSRQTEDSRHARPTFRTFLRLRGVTRTYPGVIALRDVSLDIAAGEVVGLIGENGAGKSTLMNILGGVIAPTFGTIEIGGARHDRLTVQQSFDAGIAFVHQELNAFDNLDVAANVLLGREITSAGIGGWLGLIDRAAMARKVRPILDRVGAHFAPDTPVALLSLAEQQLLEIAKALSMNARLVILDEPTSSLTITETNTLLGVIEELRADGISVLFISHRLNEVKACADRVVVLRDGQVVGHLAKHEITHDAMIRLMIGRSLKDLYDPPARPPGAAALRINGVRTQANPRAEAHLDVHAGEILGLAGLVGSGRTELARAVFGIDKLRGGAVVAGGPDAGGPRPRRRHRRRAVSGARGSQGLRADPRFPHRREHFAGRSRRGEQARLCRPRAGAGAGRGATRQPRHPRARRDTRRRRAFGRQPAEGGAGQMAVDAPEGDDLRRADPRHRRRRQGRDLPADARLADAGVAILMISSDMEEVIGVSDRVAVMSHGRITGILERSDFRRHRVLTMAVG